MFIWVGSGYPNFDPHGYTASAFSTEPSSRPQFIAFHSGLAYSLSTFSWGTSSGFKEDWMSRVRENPKAPVFVTKCSFDFTGKGNHKNQQGRGGSTEVLQVKSSARQGGAA